MRPFPIRARPMSPVPTQQRGAALVVALILLLVMTILGITALNSSTLQNFMSSAYQQQTTTLAGAENVLLEGEVDVEAIVTSGVGGKTHFRDLTDDDETQFDLASWGEGWPVTQDIGEITITGSYFIEYMGEFEVPGESIAEGGGLEDSKIHIFRVSARGGEANRGAIRTVQSYYVTLQPPN